MSSIQTWLNLMNSEGAFDYSNGDLIGTDSNTSFLHYKQGEQPITDEEVQQHIDRQKSKGRKREHLTLPCGERMIPGPFEDEQGRYLSVIDTDKGIVDSWREFRPMSAATIRKMFWRVM